MCWVVNASLRLSTVSRGLLFIELRGLLAVGASLVAEHRLEACGLQWVWCTGLGAPERVQSSRTRAGTCVLCIGRWILNLLSHQGSLT